MCFAWISEQTVAFVLCIINRLVFITEVESVYCAVRTESLYKIPFVLEGYVTEMSVQAWTGPYGSRRLRLPEFPDNRHMCMVWLSAVCTGRPISVRDWVDPEATVRLGGLSQLKIPMTPTGIEPTISRFVAPSPNQLRHCIFNPLKSGG